MEKWRAVNHEGEILAVVEGEPNKHGYSINAFLKVVGILMERLPAEEFLGWLNEEYNFMRQCPEWGDEDLKVGLYL